MPITDFFGKKVISTQVLTELLYYLPIGFCEKFRIFILCCCFVHLTNFNASPQPSHFHICSLSTVYWETMDEGFTLASTSWCNIIVHWQRDNLWHEYNDRHDFSCVWHCYQQSWKHLHSALTICCTTPTQSTVYRQHATHGTVLCYPHRRLKWEKAFTPFPWKSWDRTQKKFCKIMSCLFTETYTTLLNHSVKMCKKWQHLSLRCELHSLVNSSYYYQYISIAHDI